MMTRTEILAAANARGFTIEENGPGILTGSHLPFPIVHAKNNRAVSFEVSWALAERLATGTTTQVSI